jgi:hypothetical protein
MLEFPVCTHLIPARDGSQTPKGEGEYSMVGKGAEQRSHLASPRQHKVCMAKATLLESQSPRCHSPRRRRVVEATYWANCVNRHAAHTNKDMVNRRRLPCSSLSQRAPYRGMKGTNGTPKHTASLSHRNCGIAYTGRTEAWTCRATEPPYYSRWTHNRVCSQPKRLDRQGYKGMVTTPKSPTVREEGRQLLSLQGLRTRGQADATR